MANYYIPETYKPKEFLGDVESVLIKGKEPAEKSNQTIPSAASNVFIYGTDESDSEKVRLALFRYKDSYKASKYWGNSFNKDFDEALGFIIKGIGDGSIRNVDESGNFNYTGLPNDFVDGSNKRKTKALLAAAEYANIVIRDGIDNKKLTLAELPTYSRNLGELLKNKVLAGQEWDTESVNNFIKNPLNVLILKGIIDSQIDKMRNKKLDLKDLSLDEELSDWEKASLALADGQITEDEYILLNALGLNSGDTKILYGKKEVTDTSAENDIWNKRREELKALGMSADKIEELIAAEKVVKLDAENKMIEDTKKAHLDVVDQKLELDNQQRYIDYMNSNYGTLKFNRLTIDLNGNDWDPTEFEEWVVKNNINTAALIPQMLNNINGYYGLAATLRTESGSLSLGSFLDKFKSLSATSSNLVSNKKVLLATLNYLVDKHPDLFISLDNGELLIKNSVNTLLGMGWAFNPMTKQIRTVSAGESLAIQAAIQREWMLANNISGSNTSTPGLHIAKNGGILKYQEGGLTEQPIQLETSEEQTPTEKTLLFASYNSSGSFWATSNPLESTSSVNIVDSIRNNMTTILLEEDEAMKAMAEQEGRTLELYKAGHRKIVDENGKVNLTAREYWDMGNIAADIVSMIAAWVPGYGTAVSATLGYGSTVSRLAHDLTDDSVSAWQTLKGLGEGLLLDTVGLIPVLGTASKTAKVAKTIIKLAPTVLAAYGSVTEFAPALDAIKKLTTSNGKDLTLDEWKHIGNFFMAISGTSRVAASHVKTKIMANEAKGSVTNEFSFKDKNNKTITLQEDGAKELVRKYSSDPSALLEKLRAFEVNGTKPYKDIEIESFKQSWYNKGPLKKKVPYTDKTNNPNSSWWAPYDEAAPASQRVQQYDNPLLTNWINKWGKAWNMRTDYDLAVNGGFNPFKGTWGLGIKGSNPWSINNPAEETPTNAPKSNAPTNAPENTQTNKPKRLPINPAKSTLPEKPTVMDVYRRAMNEIKLNPELKESSAKINLRKYISDNFKVDSKTSLGNKNKVESIINALKDPKLLESIRKLYNFKEGGKLSATYYLKALRGNFTEDNSTTSEELSSMAQGGILKAALGDVLVIPKSDWQWYEDLYTQKELENAALRDINLRADITLLPNHNMNFDLGRAATKNDAYINNRKVVSLDLLSYYDAAYALAALDDFIEKYNLDAAKIRATWEGDTHHKANTLNGMSTHNRLFKAMFNNRSLAGDDKLNLYNIGYLDNLDDVMGTSTWMRRMDRYKKEWENTDDEDKRSRIHRLKLGDGSYGYVYKKANGDIAKLDEKEYLRLLGLEMIKPTKVTKEESKSESKNDPNYKFHGSNVETGHSIAKKAVDIVNNLFDGELAADLLAYTRYKRNDLSNKKSSELVKNGLSTVEKDHLTGKLQVVRNLNPERSVDLQEAAAVNLVDLHKSADFKTNTLALAEIRSRFANPQLLATATADADVKKQIDSLVEEEKTLLKYNSDVDFFNRTARANYKKAIADLDAGENAARMLNLLTYLSEIEARVRLKNANILAMKDSINARDYNEAVANDPTLYLLLKDWKTETDIAKKNEILEKLELRLKEVNALAYEEYIKRYYRDHGYWGSPLGMSKTWTPSTATTSNTTWKPIWNKAGGQLKMLRLGTFRYKDGGDLGEARIKARTLDIKEFNRVVRDSIKETLKSLDNLSRSTLLAIKKALNQ